MNEFDVINAWKLDFYLGNVVSFIAKASRKRRGSLENLKKAREYLDRKISELEPPPVLATNELEPVDMCPECGCTESTLIAGDNCHHDSRICKQCLAGRPKEKN